MIDIPENLPLLDLFLRIREEPEFDLGITDYQTLLEALRLGFGLPDRAALRRLCIMLWVRSNDPDVLRVFDHHFNDVLQAPFLQEVFPSSDTAAPNNSINTSSQGSDTGELSSDIKPSLPGDQISSQQLSNSAAELAKIIVEGDSSINDENIDRSTIFLHRDPEYFPITQRQMKQAWRHLRRMRRAGPHIELDFDSTVRQIADEGVLRDVVLMPRRVNQAQLLLLIDCNGSMLPFHSLSNRIHETARTAGKLGNASAFYFTNVAILITRYLSGRAYYDYRLYKQPPNQNPTTLRTVLVDFVPENTSVMIVSDGGSVRGNKNPKRISETHDFILYLKQLGLQSIVWLNPMPESRWQGSSAESISSMVPMSSLSRRGFENIVTAMRAPTPLVLE